MNGNGLPTPQENGTPLETIKQELQQIIESYIELGVIIHDYPDEANSKQALDHKLNVLIKDMAQISRTSHDLRDINIPLDILDYIDAGRNPDIYSREFVEIVVKQNQFINGKMQAMAQFRDVLGSELSKAFPDISENIESVVTLTTDKE